MKRTVKRLFESSHPKHGCGICGAKRTLYMVSIPRPGSHGVGCCVMLLCDTCDCQPIDVMCQAVTA